jgi:hypothetical protein
METAITITDDDKNTVQGTNISGDACVATNKKTIQRKSIDKGIISVYMDIPQNHIDNVNWIFKLNSNNGNRNKSKNNFKYHDDEYLSYTEGPNDDTKHVASSEEGMFDKIEAKKYKKALKEASKLKRLKRQER